MAEAILRTELKKRKINLLSPNINIAKTYFYPTKTSIIFPLNLISSISTKIAENIIEEREKNGSYLNFKNFIIRAANFDTKLSDKHLSNLIDSGAFDSFLISRKKLKQVIPDALLLLKNSKAIYYLDNDQKDFIYKNDVNEDKIQDIKNEINSIGLSLSDSIFNYVKIDDNSKKKIVPIYELENKKNSLIIGMIESIKVIKTKKASLKNNDMAFIKIFTNDDNIEGVIFPTSYLAYQNELNEGNIYLFYGYKEEKNEKTSFIINKIKKVDLYE